MSGYTGNKMIIGNQASILTPESHNWRTTDFRDKNQITQREAEQLTRQERTNNQTLLDTKLYKTIIPEDFTVPIGSRKSYNQVALVQLSNANFKKELGKYNSQIGAKSQAVGVGPKGHVKLEDHDDGEAPVSVHYDLITNQYLDRPTG